MDFSDIERAIRDGMDPRELARVLNGERLLPAPDSGAPAWRKKLSPALHVPEPRQDRPVALLFELTTASGYSRQRRTTLGVRPLTVSAAGNWVRSELGWPDLFSSYQDPGIDPAVVDALRRLYMQGATGYGYVEEWLLLREVEGPEFWTLLDELRGMGVELRHGARKAPPVMIEDTPVTPVVDIVRTRVGIKLLPAFLRDGEPVTFERYALVGTEDVHGIYTLTGDEKTADAARWARLVRFDRAADPAFLTAYAERGISIPRADLPLFLDDVLPTLTATNLMRSSDGAVAIPSGPAPTLVLGVRADLSGLEVRAEWEYALPGGVASTVAFFPHPSGAIRRDAGQEAELRAAVGVHLPSGELTRELQLAGLAAADFVARSLPLIAEIPGVRVEARQDLPAYRAADEAPIVTVGTTAGTDRDWFDLHVQVTVDGREVPFERLFVALAQEADVVVLDDGTYFPLDPETFTPLRALIEEARALSDRTGGTMRISAHQADLWDELAQLAPVEQQAGEWRAALDRLRRFDEDIPVVPAGLRAALRDYQREGFSWLERLRRAGLGGILADDMGLGKTMQVLAMHLASGERETDGRAHLVVAPTSVVGNWVNEASRFAPGLRVVAVETLGRRRGHSTIAELAANADVIVTSYALLRLEADAYAAVEWNTVVLDEAQAVKNPHTSTYRAVRALRAGARFAVTGTPLENTLMDLWALLGIAAPGLFPHRDRFTDFYRTPIERERSIERLALMHRRLRPLMLRRTKEEVASELPERIEQVVEVELSREHRRLYDTHLQRERQRVLGLLGDVQANRFEIFRSLTLLRRLALDPALLDEQYEHIESAKLVMLRELLETIVADGHRTLVFSQFTGYLRRARQMLDAAGIAYEYLDGSTTRRPEVIRRFREGDAPVFLISLKAGGSGLTLTEADYCVLLDPWWNPAVEQQAIDRTHRIGQTRNVMVYRLVSARTIEDKVMALKTDKARLFDSVISGAELSDARLTAADIRGLLAADDEVSRGDEDPEHEAAA